MPSILFPFYTFNTLSSLTATPIDPGEGTERPTMLIKCAVDTDRRNYTYIYTGGGQPIKWIYSDSFLSLIYPAFPSYTWAVYARVENAAYIDLGTDEYNYAQLKSSADGSSWTTGDLYTYYGNGTIDNPLAPTKWRLKDIAHRATYPIQDGQFIIGLGEGGWNPTHKYRQLLFSNEAASPVDIKVIQLMDGLLVTLPDNVAVAREWSEDYLGGNVSFNPMGKLIWSGASGQPHGTRKFLLTFAELDTVQKTYIFEAFKFGYGIFPMLYCHDLSLTDTWLLCVWKSLVLREPEPGLWFADVQIEEI